MSKQVLILSSSPRKGGNSDILCDQFAKGALQSGHRVEKLFLGDYTIHPCTGCGACSEHGLPCPQKDDMASILQKMLDSDMLVMATPVYFYTMSAQMKTLIDRTCARYTQLCGKEFYFIATAAEEDASLMERTIDGFRGFLDCLDDAVEKGVLLVPGVWKKGEIFKTDALQKAFCMGSSI